MKFHTEILSKEQKELLSFIKKFNGKFILVWWTAIALQLWHRKSIDFDLFLPNRDKLPLNDIIKKTKETIWKPINFTSKDYCRTVVMNWVKVTWFAYMFDIPKQTNINYKFIKIPNLLHLAAMKVHAMAQRAKWKDYVDMYFLIKEFWIKEIVSYAKDFFEWEVNIKLFASQLWFFDDINYSEKVEYMPWFQKTDDEIKKYLIEQSLLLME